MERPSAPLFAAIRSSLVPKAATTVTPTTEMAALPHALLRMDGLAQPLMITTVSAKKFAAMDLTSVSGNVMMETPRMEMAAIPSAKLSKAGAALVAHPHPRILAGPTFPLVLWVSVLHLLADSRGHAKIPPASLSVSSLPLLLLAPR
jgi:hypothetical protein